MESSTATGDGINDRRTGAGEPLLLIHGIGLTLWSWSSVLPLLEAEREVVAIDLPGFGASPPLPVGQEPTIAALAGAVERHLDRAGIDTVDVAGNSLGGWVALELARRGRAQRVVALSPAGAWTRREAAYSRWVLRLTRTGTEVVAPHADVMTRTAVGRSALFAVAAARPWRVDPERAGQTVRAFAAAPGFHGTLDWITSHALERLEEVRRPVLVAWGTQDRLLFPRQGRRLVRALPDAELRPLEGLGHVPMWDDGEVVARTILDFVSRDS